MYFKNIIPSGISIPNDIFVIIEISYGHSLIKYEVNKKYNMMFVDRFIKAPVFYPFNYGYINKTLTYDGDPLDVMVLTNYKILIGTIIHCRPIGVLKMVDESGKDYKILAVPNYNISDEYKNIQDISDISKFYLDKIIFFFQNYKLLESKKWVEIDNWYDVLEAKYIIKKSIFKN